MNSFTVTTADFVQPAVNSNVTVNVSAIGQATGIWAKVGQPIFIVGGGQYRIVSSTATTIVVTNLGGTNNAAPAATVSFPAGVSPSGEDGDNGIDGASELVTLYSATAANTTSFTALHTAQTIAADTFETVGDVMRITFVSIGDIVAANTPTDYWRYEHKITLGGIDVVLPASNPFFVSRSLTRYNGFEAVIDIIPVTVGATPVFIVDISKFQLGLGIYNGTNGYIVLPTANNTPSPSYGNVFAAGQTTGIAATTTALSFQISGRRTAVGSPSGTPSVYLPVLKIQMVKK